MNMGSGLFEPLLGHLWRLAVPTDPFAFEVQLLHLLAKCLRYLRTSETLRFLISEIEIIKLTSSAGRTVCSINSDHVSDGS